MRMAMFDISRLAGTIYWYKTAGSHRKDDKKKVVDTINARTLAPHLG